ncbi:MAG: hypothetical protein ACXW31_00810 [Thermoanaerobaculia bacterium]
MKALALVFLLFASTPIVIDTTKLADGARDVRREGGRTVSVSRDGETVVVRIEEGKRVDTITMKWEASGQLSISRRDNGEARPIIALDRPPVIVDGIDLEPFMAGNLLGTQKKDGKVYEFSVPQPERRRHAQSGPRYYTCPKDETMVRVPAGRGPAELNCPLDGTPMKAGVGRDSQIFLLH